MNDTLHLPSDLPLDESELQRHSEYRLQPVIDMLCAQLAGWLVTPRRQRRDPLRLGLFGGLGQGKSTVAGVALARLQRQRSWGRRLQEKLLGPRIARFDVSFFKADDLEWRFFTAVLFWRTARNLLVLPPLIVLLACLALGADAWTEHMARMNSALCRQEVWRCAGGIDSGWVASLMLGLIPLAESLLKGMAVLVGLLAGWRTVASASPAQGLYMSPQDLLMQALARSVFALPDVVVVDDLDRARVEQQRSFLRALTRYSRRMGFAVVVCMDDAELLAAEASPEAPEELLRKNITAELRVPDLSREDIALLAAITVREFCAANGRAVAALCDGLRSVQFVGDFARVLMLDAAHLPNSPRKLRRLLTQLALHAMQLDLSAVDDLCALLRLEGLYRLAPALRQHLDPLRQALEINRVQAFEPLLSGLALTPASRHAAALKFFERTRMMNPALRDGWFRLLGGFNRLHVARCSADLWTANWEVGPRSVDLLRVFVEAAGQDAGGYRHQLTLAASANADKFVFELPGGTLEEFEPDALPPDVRAGGEEYAACCWLAWTCALHRATPQRRHTLCRRALDWANTVPAGRRSALIGLVLREALADSEMWACLQPSQRHWWWDQVHRGGVAIERVLNIELADRDFADAWRTLARPDPDQSRDARKILWWWGHLSPEVDLRRLVDCELTDVALGAEVWPAPDVMGANSAGLRHLLSRHLLALGTLRGIPGHGRMNDPRPLREALRRALDEMEPQHLLDLLGPLAFDGSAAPGERWSVELPRSWLAEVRHHPLHTALHRFVVDGDHAALSGWPERQASPAQRRALVVVALVWNWTPRRPPDLTDGLAADELQELRTLLDERGRLCGWL